MVGAVELLIGIRRRHVDGLDRLGLLLRVGGALDDVSDSLGVHARVQWLHGDIGMHEQDHGRAAALRIDRRRGTAAPDRRLPPRLQRARTYSSPLGERRRDGDTLETMVQELRRVRANLRLHVPTQLSWRTTSTWFFNSGTTFDPTLLRRLQAHGA